MVLNPEWTPLTFEEDPDKGNGPGYFSNFL